MTDDEKENKIKMSFADTIDGNVSEAQKLQNDFDKKVIKNSGTESLLKSLITHNLGISKKSEAPRLAFTEDPKKSASYSESYKLKDRKLLPNNVIKQIRQQNFLVSSILRARGNMLAMMGHLRKDRFDVGIEISLKNEFADDIEPEDMEKVQKRMDLFANRFISCGHTAGIKKTEQMSLPDFLYLQVQNGLSFGHFDTEIVYDDNGKFHRFRPADAGSIYRAEPKSDDLKTIRQQAEFELSEITGDEIDFPEIGDSKDIEWVQVVDGHAKQGFTEDELVVYNLYPNTDIEHRGYPITPLDTCITTVVTHMSIERYNQLYFQNGRAAKGMLVVRSDDLDQGDLEEIKQQYQASVNDVTNSFRTPIFGIKKDENVEWVGTSESKKDGEFEFLFDQVTRNILTVFAMSPEELPGYSHLARGTNQQSLSESNSEYKLTAARDTGIRPLLLRFQDFFNEHLFPIMDPELSQLCMITLGGFDAETRQQESTRLQLEMPIQYSYNDLQKAIKKDIVPPSMGGEIPFNEHYRQVMDNYVPVGQTVGYFNDDPAAMVDPLLKYRKDPFFYQYLQMMAEFNPDALLAFFATRADSMDILKLFLKDFIDESDLK